MPANREEDEQGSARKPERVRKTVAELEGEYHRLPRHTDEVRERNQYGHERHGFRGARGNETVENRNHEHDRNRSDRPRQTL